VKSVFTDEYDTLLRRLLAARKLAKLTQQDLARRLGKPQSFVSKYERRERRLDVIEYLSITRAIGADPHEIIRELERNSARGRKRPGRAK